MVVVACGGTPRNTELKNRISDEKLAPIPPADRAAEVEAHQGAFLAQWQHAFTKEQLEGAKLEIKIAKNDLASAKIGMKSATMEKKAADESGDVNKMKEAARAALIAEQEAEVHKIAIDRAKQSLAYLKKRLLHEESQLRSLEAKLEYDRAASLKAAGIVPPDFKLKTYKSQYAQRKSQAKSSKAAVDAEQKELKSIDQRLAKAKAQVEATKNPSAAAQAEPAAPISAMPAPPPEVKVPDPATTEPIEFKTPPTEQPPTEESKAPAAEEPAQPEAGATTQPEATSGGQP
jgi:hypothetical protein